MIDAIVLGLVEGITEFLPVSSTGHLLLAEHLLGSHKGEAFNILIQVGPILASVLVFRHYLTGLVLGISDPAKRDEIYKLAFSFLLTGIGGLTMKKLGLELPETVLPIALATLLGALAILLIERSARKRIDVSETISWKIAAAIAAAQLLAGAFPGTSRSGAVIMTALALGLSRPAAVRFAFLVGIPTMLAAGGKQLLDAVQAGQAAELLATDTLIAFAVATASAFLVVQWLLRYVQTRDFLPFAWYRLAMGTGLLIALSLGWLA